jgi:hypothetical protein
VEATIAALVESIAPENAELINGRLSALRGERDALRERLDAMINARQYTENQLRKKAMEWLGGLDELLQGRRDQPARKLLRCYVEGLELDGAARQGKVFLTPLAYEIYEKTRPPETVGVSVGSGGSIRKRTGYI